MNRIDLQIELQRENVSENAYSLSGGLPGEKYVLSQEPSGKWSVYYSERGVKNNVQLFATEDKACQYLFHLLLSDPTTRNR